MLIRGSLALIEGLSGWLEINSHALPSINALGGREINAVEGLPASICHWYTDK